MKVEIFKDSNPFMLQKAINKFLTDDFVIVKHTHQTAEAPYIIISIWYEDVKCE